MADRPSTSKSVMTNISEVRETSEYDPALDFYSDKFDPLKALLTAHIKVPVPDAKVYDNLAKYEAVVIRGLQAAGVKAKQEMAPIFERRFEPHQMPIPTMRKEMIKRTVFTQMNKFEGPLALLKKCVDERTRLKVWTRHSHGIRGYCLSFCAAFDKHWNLALEDVTEVWSRPRSRKVPALASRNVPPVHPMRKIVPPKVTITKTTKKEEFCERYVPQLIVRGEQIAFITLIKI